MSTKLKIRQICGNFMLVWIVYGLLVSLSPNYCEKRKFSSAAAELSSKTALKMAGAQKWKV